MSDVQVPLFRPRGMLTLAEVCADFCLSYVDMKWKGASAKHRANIAWALVTVTPAMFASDKGKPADKAIRSALRQWAFNGKRRVDTPADAAITLKWVARNTKPVSSLADPKVVRAVLDTAATLLDRTPAAASTVRGNRAILGNVGEYAVELRLLPKNPFKAIKWRAPKTTSEVDRRCVNHVQARALLAAVLYGPKTRAVPVWWPSLPSSTVRASGPRKP